MTTWAQHVGKFAERHNIKLGQAMKNSKCKQEWKQMKHGGNTGLKENVDGGAELEQKNMEVKVEGGSRRRRRSMKKSSRRRGRSLKNKSRKNKK